MRTGRCCSSVCKGTPYEYRKWKRWLVHGATGGVASGRWSATISQQLISEGLSSGTAPLCHALTQCSLSPQAKFSDKFSDHSSAVLENDDDTNQKPAQPDGSRDLLMPVIGLGDVEQRRSGPANMGPFLLDASGSSPCAAVSPLRARRTEQDSAAWPSVPHCDPSLSSVVDAEEETIDSNSWRSPQRPSPSPSSLTSAPATASRRRRLAVLRSLATLSPDQCLSCLGNWYSSASSGIRRNLASLGCRHRAPSPTWRYRRATSQS